jgi:hypothetical protein
MPPLAPGAEKRQPVRIIHVISMSMKVLPIAFLIFVAGIFTQ